MTSAPQSARTAEAAGKLGEKGLVPVLQSLLEADTDEDAESRLAVAAALVVAVLAAHYGCGRLRLSTRTMTRVACLRRVTVVWS